MWFFFLGSGAYQYVNIKMADFKLTRKENMNYVMELHFWQTMIMTVVAMAQFHFFYYATKQIATGLGIRIFRAKKVKVPKVNKKDK